MSDILTRMRQAADNLSEIYPDYAEAADEIERLRAELAAEQEALANVSRKRDELQKAVEEIDAVNDRLRAELAAAIEHVRNTDDACNRYAAERDALREALREAREAMDNAAWLSDAENVMELEAVKRLRANVARIDALLKD